MDNTEEVGISSLEALAEQIGQEDTESTELSELQEEIAQPEEEQVTEQVPDLPVIEEKKEEPETAVTTEVEPGLNPLLAQKAEIERELRRELEEKKAQLDSSGDILEQLKKNPQAFIAKYGAELDLGNLVTHFHAADLGDEAPEELKAIVGRSNLERYKVETEQKLSSIDEKISSAVERAKAEMVVGQYQGFVSNIPESFKFLSADMKADPESTFQKLAETADIEYSRTGQYPSPEQAAGIMESKMKEKYSRYAHLVSSQPEVKKEVITPQTTKNETQVQNQTRTLTNKPTTDVAYSSALELAFQDIEKEENDLF